MKVHSLYYKNTFIVAFDTREKCIEYGEQYYKDEVWDCEIRVEYIQSESPKKIQYPPKETYPYISPYNPYKWTCDGSEPINARFS